MTWGQFIAAYSWQFVMLAALLAASGFFSGTETALFSLTRSQLYRLRQKRSLIGLVDALATRPRRILNTLLFGNMLVNVAFTGISAVIIISMESNELVGPFGAALISLIPLLALILIGEVMPKMLAFVVAEPWTMVVAAPVAVIGRVLRVPLVVLDSLLVAPLIRMVAPRSGAGSVVTAEELGAILDLSAKRGVIDRNASSLLQEIMELSDLRVRDIMVPRVDLVAYDVDAPADGLLELFRKTHLRKIPVFDGGVDKILGVIHAKLLLLEPHTPLRQLVVEVPFVPEAGVVERSLLQLRVTRSQMAIVVDEYGGTAGLVTLEDILEEIVGDIPDPHDIEQGPAVVAVSDTEYILDGDLAIHEWSDAFKMDLSGRRISTIGGFVTSLLGRIPRAGETVTYRNLRFTVESMRRRRIGKIRLERLEGGQ